MVLPVNYKSISEVPEAELAGFKRVGKTSVTTDNVKVKTYTYQREVVSKKMYKLNRFTGLFLTAISLGLFKACNVFNTKNLLKGFSKKDVKVITITKNIEGEKKSKKALVAELQEAQSGEALKKLQAASKKNAETHIKLCTDLKSQKELLTVEVNGLKSVNAAQQAYITELETTMTLEKEVALDDRAELCQKALRVVQIASNSRVLVEKLAAEVTLLKACMTPLPLPADDEVLA